MIKLGLGSMQLLATAAFKWVNSENAHIAARNVADTGRLIPGTPGFQSALIIKLLMGAYWVKLVDNSRIYHSDANYNFRDLIKFAEIQVGGSFRQYS
jgi:hypothetical protein